MRRRRNQQERYRHPMLILRRERLGAQGGQMMKRELEIVGLIALMLSFIMMMTPKASAQNNQSETRARPRPMRPVHTFSIVARDPVTGEIGVAVQSHWFSVGATVPWAEAGIGAVATQSFVD